MELGAEIRASRVLLLTRSWPLLLCGRDIQVDSWTGSVLYAIQPVTTDASTGTTPSESRQADGAARLAAYVTPPRAWTCAQVRHS